MIIIFPSTATTLISTTAAQSFPSLFFNNFTPFYCCNRDTDRFPQGRRLAGGPPRRLFPIMLNVGGGVSPHSDIVRGGVEMGDGDEDGDRNGDGDGDGDGEDGA